MNSRERYLRAIHFARPDRVPLMHRTLPGAFHHYGQALADLYRRYPSDVMGVGFGETVDEEQGIYLGKTDEWGCVWDSLTDDYLGRVIDPPLANWESLDSYRFPDPLYGLGKLEQGLEKVRADDHQHFVTAGFGHLWHRINYLRGFENSLLDVMDDREELYYLRDRITDLLVKRIEKLAEHRDLIDAVVLNDDWGNQDRLQVRPEYWRKIFKPAYRRQVEAAHAGGQLASMHTDGQTRDIIPDLIEIGLDEINPQIYCMDVEELGREFEGKVCFRADLDRQYTLPFGTPAEVEAHVLRAFEAFGRHDGGYIGYGQIGTDVPMRNGEAMLATICGLRY
ncbi:MAG: hypothetical protein HYY04_11830 [Chloroflexi bacterium]|nr:hypothetical protein [Chloroflexota bacterium]